MGVGNRVFFGQRQVFFFLFYLKVAATIFKPEIWNHMVMKNKRL
jgi:hypothetical protein